MSDFLDQVVKEKEIELVQKRAARSLAELKDWVASAAGHPGEDLAKVSASTASRQPAAGGVGDDASRRSPDLSVRDLATALRSEASEHSRGGGRAAPADTRIIAEIKRRSPSVRQFRQQGPAAELAKIYAENGAAAISIVTDTPNFGMSLRDVAVVREASGLPVLVKEFVIDPYQVYEARAHGADALLLIVRILSREKLAELHALVTDLGMAALVECHGEADVRKALEAGARIVGINNRNLADLSVSLDNTWGRLEMLPRDVISVSESGIDQRSQVVELASSGIDAFLIGTALLQSPDPGKTLRELRGQDTADRGEAGLA